MPELIATTFTGATAAGAVGAGSTVLSVLQGAMSVFSVLSTLGAANTQAASLKDQAVAKGIETTSVEAERLQRQAQMQRELARIAGENDVAFAAAGIDISTGVAADARHQDNIRAANQIGIDRSDADKRKAMLRWQAAGLRSRARAVRRGGQIAAAGALGRTGIRMLRRG